MQPGSEIAQEIPPRAAYMLVKEAREHMAVDEGRIPAQAFSLWRSRLWIWSTRLLMRPVCVLRGKATTQTPSG